MKLRHAKRLVTACVFVSVLLTFTGSSLAQSTCANSAIAVNPATFHFLNSGGSNSFQVVNVPNLCFWGFSSGTPLWV
ncbi:MAG TPA: hypothetical protein VIK39_09410, partial [Candidatus Angelobacter sp.]